MTLLGKMDRLVYATGIDRIIFMKFQPRMFRWMPLLVITALVAGYVLMTERPVTASRYLLGWLIFYGAFLAAGLLRVFGPRFRPTLAHPLDERELVVRARAYATSGIVLAGFAMIGCFYMSSAGLLGLWSPNAPLDWINLGFGIQAAAILLPTLIASWLEPRPVPDFEG